MDEMESILEELALDWEFATHPSSVYLATAKNPFGSKRQVTVTGDLIDRPDKVALTKGHLGGKWDAWALYDNKPIHIKADGATREGMPPRATNTSVEDALKLCERHIAEVELSCRVQAKAVAEQTAQKIAELESDVAEITVAIANRRQQAT